MKKIAIFASGSGTNFQRIAEYFKGNADIKVDILIVNKKDAYAIERAKNLALNTCIIIEKIFIVATKF